MKPLCHILLLLSATATVDARVVEKGLILDLDADRGVELEDSDRVVQWTNQVVAFAAKDFLKRDKGRRGTSGKSRCSRPTSTGSPSRRSCLPGRPATTRCAVPSGRC